MKFLLIIISCLFWSGLSQAQIPIKVCYHWLKERSTGVLTYKYNHAEKAKGELSFYNSGGVAGNGLYCAGNLMSSSDYGDRVIRVELVEDTVFVSTPGRAHGREPKTCGLNGKFYAQAEECQSKTWDVNYYDASSKWYVINSASQNAVFRWSANSDALIEDLKQAKLTYPAYANRFQTAIDAIMAERNASGQKVFINSQARMQLWDILQDPARLANLSKLSLLSMISQNLDPRMTEAKRTELINKYMPIALKDESATFTEFSSAIAGNEKLTNAFKSNIAKISPNTLSSYNPLVIIGAIDNGLLKPQDALISSVMKLLMANQAAGDSTLKVFKNLKADSVFKTKFFSLLPSPQKMAAELNEKSAISMLALLNLMATPQTEKAKEYAQVVIEKIMKSSDSQQFDLAFNSITNAALKKEEVVFELVNKTIVTLKDKNRKVEMDPISLALLVDKFSNKLGPQKIQELMNEIKELDLADSQTSAAEMLNQYVAGTVRLPNQLGFDWYSKQLLKKAIKQKEAGADINLYKFIESGLTAVYVKGTGHNQYYRSRYTQLPELKKFFFEVAEILIQNGYPSYATLAIHNATAFKGDPIAANQIEKLLPSYRSGDLQADSKLENIIKMTTDANLLRYLIGLTEDPSWADRGKPLLELQVRYLVSQDFEKLISSSQFKAFQAESIQLKMMSRLGFGGDICDYWATFRSYEEKLKSIELEPDQWTRLSYVRFKSEREFCAGR